MGPDGDTEEVFEWDLQELSKESVGRAAQEVYRPADQAAASSSPPSLCSSHPKPRPCIKRTAFTQALFFDQLYRHTY